MRPYLTVALEVILELTPFHILNDIHRKAYGVICTGGAAIIGSRTKLTVSTVRFASIFQAEILAISRCAEIWFQRILAYHKERIATQKDLVWRD